MAERKVANVGTQDQVPPQRRPQRLEGELHQEIGLGLRIVRHAAQQFLQQKAGHATAPFGKLRDLRPLPADPHAVGILCDVPQIDAARLSRKAPSIL